MSAWKPDPAGERQEVTEKRECVTKSKGVKRKFNSFFLSSSSKQTPACVSPINFHSELESTA